MTGACCGPISWTLKRRHASILVKDILPYVFPAEVYPSRVHKEGVSQNSQMSKKISTFGAVAQTLPLTNDRVCERKLRWRPLFVSSMCFRGAVLASDGMKLPVFVLVGKICNWPSSPGNQIPNSVGHTVTDGRHAPTQFLEKTPSHQPLQLPHSTITKPHVPVCCPARLTHQ